MAVEGFRPKAILLDMDGVLYHGSRVLPQALAFMQNIRQLPHLFITNNPIATPAAVTDRLAAQPLPDWDVDDLAALAEAWGLPLH